MKASLLECAVRVPQENLVKERWWRSLAVAANREEVKTGVEALRIPEIWKDVLRERLHR